MMVSLKKRNLLVLAGILFVTGACVQADHAPIAQVADSQSAQPVDPSAAATSSSQPPQQPLYYVCGTPGMVTHASSPDRGHPFNMGISFVSASNGAPLSAVAVKVRRHGRVLLDFVAAGSRCLFSAPEADYRIEGTYRGEMKFEIVQTGNMKAQIKW